MKHKATVDISPEAQIANIEKSFAKLNNDFDLSKVKHPTKPNLKPIDSWEIFPDPDVWANAYDVFKFSERPGERPLDVSVLIGPRTNLISQQQEDPRLDYALLRPMESEGDRFLAYYLMKNEEEIPVLEEQRASAAAGEASGEVVCEFTSL